MKIYRVGKMWMRVTNIQIQIDREESMLVTKYMTVSHFLVNTLLRAT